MVARVIDITTGTTISAGVDKPQPVVKCRICGERPRILVFEAAFLDHVCDEFDISMDLKITAATDAQVLAKWNRLMRT